MKESLKKMSFPELFFKVCAVYFSALQRLYFLKGQFIAILNQGGVYTYVDSQPARLGAKQCNERKTKLRNQQKQVELQ